MKYVSLEEIQKFPIRRDHYDEINGHVQFVLGIESLLEWIGNLPTEELVVCKKCRYYIPEEDLDKEDHLYPISTDGFCAMVDKYTNEDDFCSCGKER